VWNGGAGLKAVRPVGGLRSPGQWEAKIRHHQQWAFRWDVRLDRVLASGDFEGWTMSQADFLSGLTEWLVLQLQWVMGPKNVGLNETGATVPPIQLANAWPFCMLFCIRILNHWSLYEAPTMSSSFLAYSRSTFHRIWIWSRDNSYFSKSLFAPSLSPTPSSTHKSTSLQRSRIICSRCHLSIPSAGRRSWRNSLVAECVSWISRRSYHFYGN